MAGEYSRWFPPGSLAKALDAMYLTESLARPSSTKSLSSTAITLIAIGAGVLLLLVTTVLTLMWRRAAAARNNDNAPTDAAAPFTLVFTDIQASTTLWSEVPDVMGSALDTHHEIIRRLIAKHSGYEVKTVGGRVHDSLQKCR